MSLGGTGCQTRWSERNCREERGEVQNQRENWPENIREDMKRLNLTWKDDLDAEEDMGWMEDVARCAIFTGWTKV